MHLRGLGYPQIKNEALKSSQVENTFLSKSQVHTWRESSVDNFSQFTDLGRH